MNASGGTSSSAARPKNQRGRALVARSHPFAQAMRTSRSAFCRRCPLYGNISRRHDACG